MICCCCCICACCYCWSCCKTKMMNLSKRFPAGQLQALTAAQKAPKKLSFGFKAAKGKAATAANKREEAAAQEEEEAVADAVEEIMSL